MHLCSQGIVRGSSYITICYVVFWPQADAYEAAIRWCGEWPVSRSRAVTGRPCPSLLERNSALYGGEKQSRAGDRQSPGLHETHDILLALNDENQVALCFYRVVGFSVRAISFSCVSVAAQSAVGVTSARRLSAGRPVMQSQGRQACWPIRFPVISLYVLVVYWVGIYCTISRALRFRSTLDRCFEKIAKCVCRIGKDAFSAGTRPLFRRVNTLTGSVSGLSGRQHSVRHEALGDFQWLPTSHVRSGETYDWAALISVLICQKGP